MTTKTKHKTNIIPFTACSLISACGLFGTKVIVLNYGNYTDQTRF